MKKIITNNYYSKLIVLILLMLITAIGAYLRFYDIGKLSFWNDEIFSYFEAKMSIGSIFNLDPNMSLFHFFAHWWVRIFPNATDTILRILPAIFSILSIPIIYLLGSEMEINRNKSVSIGLIASFMLAINAYNIQYAQEFRGYSLLFLLIILSTLFLIKAVKYNEKKPQHSNPWWFWHAFAGAAAVYTHFFALFILLAHAFSLVVLRFGNKKNFPLQEAIGSYIIVAFLIFPVLNDARIRGAEQISWITPPNLKSLSTFAIEISGNQGIQLLGLYILSVIAGIFVGVGKWSKKILIPKWEYLLITSCLFFPVILTLIFSEIKSPIFLDRYLLLIMPYSTILAAAGIVSLANLGKNAFLRSFSITSALIIFAIIFFLSSIGINSYYNNYKKEEWKEVAEFVSQNCSGSKDLRLYYQTYTERDTIYYNPKLKSQVYNWIEILNKSTTSENIENSIPINNSNKVCLVTSHVGVQNLNVQRNIEKVVEKKFPKLVYTKFYEINVEQYSKPKKTIAPKEKSPKLRHEVSS